jgi:hypothetical protein
MAITANPELSNTRQEFYNGFSEEQDAKIAEQSFDAKAGASDECERG